MNLLNGSTHFFSHTRLKAAKIFYSKSSLKNLQYLKMIIRSRLEIFVWQAD